MTESVYESAKKLHDQMESISDFVNNAKSDDVNHIDVSCNGSSIKISKGSQVYKTILDFCEKGLIQLNDKFQDL